MRKGGGRAKGHNYERVLAKLLQSWWGRKVTRTPLSGGWGSNKDFGTQGDLLCKGGWPFCFELKKQEDWHFEQLLTGEKCSLRKWWKQVIDSAARKTPVLIFSRNHMPNFVMMRASDWYRFSPNWEPFDRVEAFMEDTNDRVFILKLEHFLAINPPKPSPNRRKKKPLPKRKRRLTDVYLQL